MPKPQSNELHRAAIYCGIAALFIQTIAWIQGASSLELSVAGFFTAIALTWFLALRCVVTPLFVVTLLSWVTLEWFYQYGAVGPAYFVTLWLLAIHFRESLLEFDSSKRTIRAASFWMVIALAVSAARLLILVIRNTKGLGSVNAMSETLHPSVLAFSSYLALLTFSQEIRVRLSNAGAFVLLALFSFALFIATTTRIHEYYYFFEGVPSYSVHPEQIGAIIILGLVVWGIFLDRYSKIDASLTKSVWLALLLFLVGSVLHGITPIVIPAGDSIRVMSKIFENLSWIDLLTGKGAGWKEFVSDSLFALQPKARQLPIPGFAALLFRDGLIFCLPLISLLLQPLFDVRRRADVWAFVLLVTTIAGCIVPGLSNQLSLLLLMYPLGRWTAEEISSDGIALSRADRIVRKVGWTGLSLAGLALVVLIGLSAWKVSRGPRFPIAGKKVTVSAELIRQLIIGEDFLFYIHRGIDFGRVKWTLRDTVRSAAFNRGGSTLSMQLAKVLYLPYEKTLLRKAMQVCIALYLEATMNKSEILHAYLTSVDFGNEQRGVSQAARYYFGKSPNDISADEARKLIVTIENPAEYNPGFPGLTVKARKRYQVIERRFKRLGERIDPYRRTFAVVKQTQ